MTYDTQQKIVLVEREAAGNTSDIGEFTLKLEGERGKSEKLFGKGVVLGVDIMCCDAEPLSLQPDGPSKVCHCGMEYEVEMKKGNPIVRYNNVIAEWHAESRSRAYADSVKTN